MKYGKFEVGDEVECVDGGKMEITNGKKYIIEKETTCESCINIRDDTGIVRSYFYSRFKPTFTPEYFSALNEKDAEKYIGKVMEFADNSNIRNGKQWYVSKFLCSTPKFSSMTFTDEKENVWDFMRTCPETFQKKKVKKTVERWVNVNKNGAETTYRYFEDAMADRDDIGCIACIHLIKEYEVEE